MAETTDLTDEQIDAFLEDPATIPTHEVAREIIECLDSEIASIQAKIDATQIEANVRPLSEERLDWVRRASFAASMRKSSRRRVYERDKEIRGFKGQALMEPKISKEEKLLKHQRMLAEAEANRDKKKLAVEREKTRQMELAEKKRVAYKASNAQWNEAIDLCSTVALQMAPTDELAKRISIALRGLMKAPQTLKEAKAA